MTTSAANADLIQRLRFTGTLTQVSHPTPFRHLSTVINRPLPAVLAHLRSATPGKEGQTCESDPTLETSHVSWARQISVLYTVYEVPGGAQVTASIESAGHSRFDPVTIVAVRFVSRRIATDLLKLRDDLE